MSETIRSYRDLKAWQLALDACLAIYRATSRFPDSERFALTNQLRRAAVSVPSNIAEGYGRGARAEYVRFCRIARGSLFEIETQLFIASELGYLDHGEYESIKSQLQESGRVLAGLLRSLKGVESQA